MRFVHIYFLPERLAMQINAPILDNNLYIYMRYKLLNHMNISDITKAHILGEAARGSFTILVSGWGALPNTPKLFEIMAILRSLVWQFPDTPKPRNTEY